MVAINTNDIISESTDLGDTVVGKRNARPVATATSKAVAIIERIALLDLPCYGIAAHQARSKARTALHGALLTASRVAPTAPLATPLNRRMVA